MWTLQRLQNPWTQAGGRWSPQQPIRQHPAALPAAAALQAMRTVLGAQPASMGPPLPAGLPMGHLLLPMTLTSAAAAAAAMAAGPWMTMAGEQA